MAKALRTVAIVAGAAALVATGVGIAMGPAAFTATFGVSATTVASVASVVAPASSISAPLVLVTT